MIKKLILLCIVTTSFCAYTEQEVSQDLITVVLMVKNEEAFMAKTLEPFVLAGIHSFFIFDTGSTDNTIAVTEEFFKSNHVQRYVIIQEPFIDFATSRNRALDLAEERFPESPFFLMIDAEWYMHNVQGLIDFCAQNRDATVPCYLIRIVNQIIEFTVPRLIRGKTGSRFVGVVHENIPVKVGVRVPTDVYFELGESRQGTEKSRKRWERDAELLLQEYEKNPQDSRTTFYLAQTHECLGNITTAYHFYKLREQQKGWLEEDYQTLYRLGCITDYLSGIDSKNYDWNVAYNYYCAAFNMLPHRAEPLIRIAQHYWPDTGDPLNVPLCYIFARRACELSYPEKDYLFKDPYLYHFKRYELLSKSAVCVGDIENGEKATRLALQFQELPYLLFNLALYVQRRLEAQ